MTFLQVIFLGYIFLSGIALGLFLKSRFASREMWLAAGCGLMLFNMGLSMVLGVA